MDLVYSDMDPSPATNQLYGLAGYVASLRLSSSEKEEASRTLVATHPTPKAYLWQRRSLDHKSAFALLTITILPPCDPRNAELLSHSNYSNLWKLLII